MSIKEKFRMLEKAQQTTQKIIDRIYYTEINYNKVDEVFATGAKFTTGDIKTNILIFQLSLYENYIDLTDEDIRVYVNILKPDKKRVVMDCEIVDATQGVVSIELPHQAVLVEGEHFVEIVIQKANMEKLISPQATYTTYASIEGRYELEESECVYPIITKVLEDIDFLKKNKIDKVELIGNAIKFYVGDLEKFSIALPINDEAISTETTWSSKKIDDTKANKVDLDTHTKNNTIHLTEGEQTIKGTKTFENTIQLNNPSAITINGGQIEMITPEVESNWSSGFIVSNSKGQPSIGGFGFCGIGEVINGAYIGVGTDAWNKSKNLTIGSEEITFKGKELATMDKLIWDNILNRPELLKGDKGDTGSAGVTPNITIGDVTTLEPNQLATVTKRGTIENPIFDFGIPKGDSVDLSNYQPKTDDSLSTNDKSIVGAVNEVVSDTFQNKIEIEDARTATTGEQFDSLDERIDCEVDRLNKKIEVSMLQQEDKESHTVENTVDGMTTDMVVKGRTLINNVKLGNVSNVIGISDSTVARYSYHYNLKNNIDYTIIFEVENKTDDNHVRISLNAGAIGSAYNVRNGVNVFKIRSANEFNNEIWFYYHRDSVDGSGSVKNIIVLEGDWTNKPIPEFFEGIKSFGQQEDKISILSHGKNLWNKELFVPKLLDINSWGTQGAYRNNEQMIYLEKGKYYITIPDILVPPRLYPVLGIKDKSGTSLGGILTGGVYNNEGSDTPKLVPKRTTTFTIIDEGYYYFNGIFQGGWTQENLNKYKSILESNFQIERSSSPTEYEPYKEDKKDILLQELGFDEGLRGFDTNSCDVLNDVSKKAIKRIEKDIITGDEDFQKAGNANYYFLIGNNHKPLSKTLNNKYPDKNCSNVEENGLWCGNAYKLCIKDLSVNTVEELKTKLKQWYVEENPLIIYYELAEPVETPLTESITLKVYNEKTHVSFENALSGTSSFKAPVDSAKTISRLSEENKDLVLKNINLSKKLEETTITLEDKDVELLKQNIDLDFRVMEIEFALTPNYKAKQLRLMSPYEMMKEVILSGNYDKEDYMYKARVYYERGRMTKEEYEELVALMSKN